MEVGALQEGSNADKSGLVCVGDRLLSVGDRDVSRLGFDAVMEALIEASSPVALFNFISASFLIACCANAFMSCSVSVSPLANFVLIACEVTCQHLGAPRETHSTVL